MERIASRLGDNNLSLATHDPELQDRKDQLDSNIRRNIVGITGYEFLPVGEEQTIDDPKPIFELPVIGISNLQPSADGIFYYHPNHLGSTCYVTDENASVVQGFLYAPFGEITNEHSPMWQNGNIPKYAFNAKELDEETGMYYYEARYYQPPVFVSRDPLFEKYPTISPYTYCANNPVKYVDPTGEEMGDPPYTGSGWGHNMRRFIANTFNVNSNINNVFEAGLNSFLQSNNVNVTGQALEKIKKDPAMKSLEKKYLESIQSDSRFGKEEFQVINSNPIQFGGK